MKKRNLFAGMALTGAALFALAGCGGSTAKALASAQDVYGMGAVTTVSLLGSEFSGEAVQRLSAVRIMDKRDVADGAQDGAEAPAEGAEQSPAEDAQTEVKTQAERFHEYFNMLDSFLGEDVVTTEAVENPDKEGRYAEYETKLTVTGKDMYGNSVSHLMYYTEKLVKEEFDGKDSEREAEYRLAGVMVVDGEDYTLRGEREYEEEADETENELKIRAYPDPEDAETYVEMKQEISVEENETEKEYVYSIVRNGELIEETAVEFETERKGGKEEAEYELEFRKGEAKGKYSVERESKNGEVKMKVEYDIDGKKGEFYIRQTENAQGEKQYEYKYSDESVLVFGD